MSDTQDTNSFATIPDFLRAIAENPQAFTEEGKRRHLLNAAHAIESLEHHVLLLEETVAKYDPTTVARAALAGMELARRTDGK